MEDKRLKQRLIGAVVLVSLGVIFIPMLLKGPDSLDAPIFTSNIPAQPEQRKTEIIPLKPLPPRPANIPITAIPVEVEINRPQPEVAVTPAKPVSPKTEVAAEPMTESKPNTRPVLSQPTTELSGWAVQVGSFSSKNNALRLQKRLRAKDYAAFVEAYQAKSGVRYRVRIGPELSSDKAKALASRLKREMGIDGLVLRHK